MNKILRFVFVCMLISITSGCIHNTDINKTTGVKGEKAYLCTYMPEPPCSATDWSRSSLLEDKRLKESRFMDYGGKKAVDPARETSFYMMYNVKGWYIYIHSKEPQMKKITTEGLSGGGLELFFMPGMENVAYYQFIINLATGKIVFYEWDVPHRYYRPVEGAMKSETIALKDGWGTFIFIPWECLYDKLPLDKEQWRFGLMRWMPALKPRSPSVTWGGHVHEAGRWGLINWEALNTSERMAFKKSIITKAWIKYQRSARQLTRKWGNESYGNPEFYQSAVKPLIDRYDQYSKTIKKLDALDTAELEKIYNLVPVWMEFKYEVDELRKNYLENKLLKPQK